MTSDILEASTSFTTARQLRESVVCSMWRGIRYTAFVTDNNDWIHCPDPFGKYENPTIVEIEGTPAQKQKLPAHGVAMKRWGSEKGEEEFSRVSNLMLGQPTRKTYNDIKEFLDSRIVSVSKYSLGSFNHEVAENLTRTFSREHITVRELAEAFEIDYITSPELKEVKREVNRVSNAVRRRENAANKVNSGSYRATLHDAWCKVYYKGETYNLEDIDGPSIFDGALTCVVSNSDGMNNDFLKKYVDSGYIIYACRCRTTINTIAKKLGMDKKDVVKEEDFRFDKMIEKGMPKYVISPKSVELVNEVNDMGSVIKPGYQLVDDILSGSDDVPYVVIDGHWPDDNRVLNSLDCDVRTYITEDNHYITVPNKFYIYESATEEQYNKCLKMFNQNIAAMSLMRELEEKVTNIMTA